MYAATATLGEGRYTIMDSRHRKMTKKKKKKKEERKKEVTQRMLKIDQKIKGKDKT